MPDAAVRLPSHGEPERESKTKVKGVYGRKKSQYKLQSRNFLFEFPQPAYVSNRSMEQQTAEIRGTLKGPVRIVTKDGNQ